MCHGQCESPASSPRRGGDGPFGSGLGKPGQGIEIGGRLDVTAFSAGLTNLSEVELAELVRLLEKADDAEIVQSQGRLA
jgi:hypothetical protein